MPNKTQAKVITKTISINRPQDVTFKLFSEEIGAWWPDNYSVAGTGSTMVLEPHRGGRLYQRSKSGQQFELGKVRAYSPPKRLMFTWKQPDWDGATEVEVTFEQQGEATKVTLEHRGWENIGRWGEDFRKDYDIGWDDILPQFIQHSEGRTKEKAKPVASGTDRPVKAPQLPPSVKRVLANPPADGLLIHTAKGPEVSKAGIKEGDVVVSFAGTRTPEWDDYYKVHCSVTNSQVVPLVVVRDGKQLTLKTPRTWIGGAAAPLWPVRKGQSIPLRPTGTKAEFDFNLLDAGPLDQWYRIDNPKGKKIGYEHHIWRKDGSTITFTYESAYELMGLHHATLTTTIAPGTPPRPLSTEVKHMTARQSIKSQAAQQGRSSVWRSEIAGDGDDVLVVEMPKDAMVSPAGSGLCAFMARRAGATWGWTPIDAYSGRVGLPLATICLGPEEISIGRTSIEAWKFEVVQIGRTLSSMWVDEAGKLLKSESRAGSLVAVDSSNALKGINPKLEPQLRVKS